MPEQMSLPAGWEFVPLGSVVKKVLKVQPKDAPEEPFHYLDISSIDNSKFKITSPKRYLGKDAPSRARQLVKTGDILFSTVRTYLKNIAQVPSIYDGEIASTGFCVIRPSENLDKSFCFYLTLSNQFIDSLSKIQRGTSYPAVRNSDVFEQHIPLPPLPEQEKIVAKIEALFTQLDAGIAELKNAQAQLKRYRQSVLKSAVEGELTKAWRESHLAELEPASQLLERILEERREKWEEEQLEKFRAKGKEPKNDKWKAKYKEPALPDAEDMPNLPDGWVWASVEQALENFDSMRIPVKASDRQEMQGEYPYYGASGIIDHVNDFLFDGDFLLIAEDGANLLSRSTPIAFQAHGKFWVNNHAHIVKTLGQCPLTYFEIFFNASNLQFYVTGTAQPKLTQRNLNKMTVPLPSLREQQRIVEMVERRLSVADEIEKELDEALVRAERLRQSVLKSAFEGRLV